MNYMGPFPTWTPDGSVLVTGLDQRARAGIYRVNLDTGAVEPLAHLVANGAGGARLSPDAKWVFYSHDVEEALPKRRLSARNVVTGETREVIQDVSGSFSLSSDGRWLALRVPTGATRSFQIVPVTGGTPRTILTFRPEEGGGFDWTPDGSALMVVRGEGLSEVWRVPVDGSTPEKLALRLPGMQTVSVSTDGRRLALVSLEQTEEVWALENVAAPQARQ
jgi:Tol biopolymer transport system component